MPAARKSSGRGVDRKRDFVSVLAALGRNGDNTVGHLTEGEIVIPRQLIDAKPNVITPFIKAMTEAGYNWRDFVVGQGARNPRTGMQEFAPKGDKSIGGSYGKDTSATPSYSGGGGGNNREAREAQYNIFATPGAPVAKAPVPQSYPVPTAAPAGGTTAPTYQQGGPMGSAGSRPGGPAATAGEEPGIFEELLGGAIGAPSGASLGLLGTLIGLTPGVGTLMGVTALARALGLEGEVDWEPGNPNPGARESSGENRQLNLDYRSPASQAIKRIATAAAAAGLIEPPGWLSNAVSGLSPLQQRAYIATQGTAGGDSGYRSKDAFNYYRGLVTDGVSDYGSVLPVEHQYLRDVWGANYQPSTSALMKALAAI